jgi:hypothetical protein
MLIVFIIVTILLCALLTFVWSTNDGVDLTLKMVFFANTVFGIIVLIGHLFPEARVEGTQMRWW